MKYYIWFIALLLIACKEQTAEEINVPVQINVDSIEQAAFNAYMDSPRQAATLFQHVAAEYSRRGNFKKSGQTNLNIAGIYEERLHDYPNALHYSKASLNDWKSANDTMQIANLYKYLGYVEGLNGNFPKAKRDIQHALKLYSKLNFNQGTAVSNINMAKVLLMEKDFEEAERFYTRAVTFWREKGKLSRVFDNNLAGILIFQNTGEYEKVQSLIKENESILDQVKINQFVLDYFMQLKQAAEKHAK